MMAVLSKFYKIGRRFSRECLRIQSRGHLENLTTLGHSEMFQTVVLNSLIIHRVKTKKIRTVTVFGNEFSISIIIILDFISLFSQ